MHLVSLKTHYHYRLMSMRRQPASRRHPATSGSRPRVDGFPNDGYTLVEMTVVVVVMAILAGSALMRLTPGLESSRISRAAAILAADLRYAQAMAARQRMPVVVIVQPSVKAYVIRDRATATVFRQRSLGQDTDYMVGSMTATPGTSIEIFPNGASQTTTTITITLGSLTRQIRFSRAGHVRIL